MSVALKVSGSLALLVTSSFVLAYLMAASGRPVTEWMIVYGLAILSIALLFTLFLDQALTTPVKVLAAAVTRMARGDYAENVAHSTQDEIGDLFSAVEFLRVSFLRQKEALEDLNRSLDSKVDERTAALSAALAELKNAQEALVRSERLASIGGLAGGVAHEINNPTGVILTRAGYLLRIAKEEKISDDVIEDLVAIQRQAERIARITGSLLSFSRQAPVSKGPVDVEEMIVESLNLLEPSLRGTDVKIERRITADLPRIHGDKGRLEQVLLNLLKNAVDAMPTGGLVTLGAVRVGEKNVALSVADTGGGIEPDVQARIFEPFYTTKEVGKGTGLGLSIAYGIVAEHGGELTVSSRVGSGTEFNVLLPVWNEAQKVSQETQPDSARMTPR